MLFLIDLPLWNTMVIDMQHQYFNNHVHDISFATVWRSDHILVRIKEAINNRMDLVNGVYSPADVTNKYDAGGCWNNAYPSQTHFNPSLGNPVSFKSISARKSFQNFFTQHEMLEMLNEMLKQPCYKLRPNRIEDIWLSCEFRGQISYIATVPYIIWIVPSMEYLRMGFTLHIWHILSLLVIIYMRLLSN